MTSFFKRNKLNLLVISFFFSLTAIAQAPRSYTSSEILLQLKKLNTVGAVLYIAAHPDDENTRLIAYLANEKCLRTGYLSLTRGDGGQNLIGPEQGVELGVIRTQELLAARRIDGGEQFFTRAYDFGFSKSPEETLQKWNRDSLLSDMVWVIRNFRPDIIITRFATDGSGGHGHHTASAILAEEAFDAAADPTRFPEQLKEVTVWKTRRLFWNVSTRFQNPNADMSSYLKLDVGGFNPLLGKSYGEIAAESRSMHKSQGFGSAKQRGEYFEYFKPIKGDTAGLKDIFQGIDFSWNRLKVKGLKKESEHFMNIEDTQESIDNVISAFKKGNYDSICYKCSYLSLDIDRFFRDQVAKATRKPENEIDNTDYLRIPAEIVPYYYLVKLKNEIVQNTFGIHIERTIDKYYVSNQSSFVLSTTGVSRMNLSWIGPVLSWTFDFSNYPKKTIDLWDYNKIDNKKDTIDFPDFYSSELSHLVEFEQDTTHFLEKKIDQLYWLKNGIKNNLFDYNYYKIQDNLLNFSSNLFLGNEVNFNINHIPQYKWVDPEKGELYRPVVITPSVMINPQTNLLTFTDNTPKELKLVLKAGRDSINGLVKIALPAGWFIEQKGAKLFGKQKVFEETGFTFSIDKKEAEKEITLIIYPLADAKNHITKINAVIDGQVYTKGIKEIKYDHIPIQTLFPKAEVKLLKLDVVKKSKRIGYIPGAGDEVQVCLTQLGYEVTTLTDDKLASENLSQYDAIITGVRAYNTNDKLPTFKQKLMDYVAAGGNLIVQYNTNSWAGPLSSDIGPYKFKITRTRITDEDAKVNFLLPSHPVFNSPNKITEKDFEGWIQERSIYHAGEWDSSYVAPISMTDPYEMTVGGLSPKGKPENGALVIAKHGKGNFVYTGLVFFRQLPAGVPGAYRLMVNLIELGK